MKRITTLGVALGAAIAFASAAQADIKMAVTGPLTDDAILSSGLAEMVDAYLPEPS